MTARLKRRPWKKGLKRKRQAVTTTQVVTAIAVSRKGTVLGSTCNTPSHIPGMRHKHAEGILMSRFGKSISKIFIIRVGNTGEQLPISPCEQCRKLAIRLGITIEEVR